MASVGRPNSAVSVMEMPDVLRQPAGTLSVEVVADYLRRHSWLFAFPERPTPRFLHYLEVSLMPRIRASRYYFSSRHGALKMNVEIYRD